MSERPAADLSFMADRIFFHIGLHKTATSWFQKRLFPSLDGVRFVHDRQFERHLPMEADVSEILLFSRETLSGGLVWDALPGDKTRGLVEGLTRIAAAAPRAGIIIGFREHADWLNSAHAQKTKMKNLSREAFVASFSCEDLSWCRVLARIEASFERVFPFLYEELKQDPDGLIHDLCGFLGTRPPRDLRRLLALHDNVSPRSLAGQELLRNVRGLRLLKPFRKYVRMAARHLDRYSAPAAFSPDPYMTGVLREDWNQLVRIVSERRGRDFSSLLIPAQVRALSESEV
jgi:hypothetical protein